MSQVNWRYDEDWSLLHTAKVEDPPWWLPAKYVPLSPGGSDWVSLGLDSRLRFEGFKGNDWGSATAPDDGYFWLRVMPHADVHVGRARAFVQLIGGDSRGVAGGPGQIDKTGIDLLQGFAELHVPLGQRAGVTFRAGRELVALGSERLVGTRYGTNIPQPFQGVRWLVHLGAARVDVFRVRPVHVGQHNFDDEPDRTRRLGGIYATLPLQIGSHSGVDLYVLDYHRDRAAFDHGTGAESRRTGGLRFFGKAGNWTWNWEAMVQRGRFGSGKIRAHSVATETSRSFPGLPLKPSLRLRANVASGDRDPSDRVLGTFNPMFPKAKYFGELSPLGPYNIINLHPSLDLELGRGFKLGLAGVSYWRESRGDGIYGISGARIRSGSGSTSRHIGTQQEAVLGWQRDAALSFTLSLSRFSAGRFIEESGPDRTIRMIALETQYRF